MVKICDSFEASTPQERAARSVPPARAAKQECAQGVECFLQNHKVAKMMKMV